MEGVGKLYDTQLFNQNQYIVFVRRNLRHFELFTLIVVLDSLGSCDGKCLK